MIGSTEEPRGLRFEGTEGSIFVHIHGGALEADLGLAAGSGTRRRGRVPWPRREPPAQLPRLRPDSGDAGFASAEIGHRTATICHLNNIAMMLGRPLAWDPVSETVVGDDEANALLMPQMRPPHYLLIATRGGGMRRQPVPLHKPLCAPSREP